MLFSMKPGEKQMVACPEDYYGAVEMICEMGAVVATGASQCKKASDMCDDMMDSCFGSPEFTHEFYGTPAPPCEDQKPRGWCDKVLEKELCDKAHGQKCKLSCGLC
jgi:hypothetical protein